MIKMIKIKIKLKITIKCKQKHKKVLFKIQWDLMNLSFQKILICQMFMVMDLVNFNLQVHYNIVCQQLVLVKQEDLVKIYQWVQHLVYQKYYLLLYHFQVYLTIIILNSWKRVQLWVMVKKELLLFIKKLMLESILGLLIIFLPPVINQCQVLNSVHLEYQEKKIINYICLKLL